MTSDITLGMAEMFRDANRESVTLELRTPQDWDRFNKIKDMAKQHEREETEFFQREKPLLLAEARKELIDKAGSLTLEHPSPFGTDRFNKDTIERQAHMQVGNDHQARLLGIKARESDGYAELREDIQAREGLRDHAREAFARSTDRRDGQDRRMPSRDR
ncbi:hypothetical protein [Sulfitobacter geojensis]|uniref:hypothetical protein n=1 Tax=Sulfitobacter geojensis TaxID=1342299 RepID=UPI0036DC34E5